MHNVETIMTLVDAHAKDMLRRFGGTNVDPDKSRAAVREALEAAITVGVDASTFHDHEPRRVTVEVPPIPTVTPPKSKRPGIFGGKK